MHYEVVPRSHFLFKESIHGCSLLGLLAVHHQCPVHKVHLSSKLLFRLLQIDFTFDQLAGFIKLLFALWSWKNTCIFQPFDNGQIHVSGRLDRPAPFNKASVWLLEELILFTVSIDRIRLAVKILSIQTLQVKKARNGIWHSFLRLQALMMMVLSRLTINCSASLG